MKDKADLVSQYVGVDFDPKEDHQDDPKWLQASIVSYSKDSREPHVAWKQLRHLKSMIPAADFRAFKTDLNSIIFPMVITEHGYKRCLGSRDQADAWGQIHAVSQTLSDLGYESFLNSGTLLGAIREGKLLAHDDDADLGVIIPGSSLDEIIEKLINLMLELADRQMLSLWHVEHGCKHISLRTELQMDLFPCWEHEGQFLAYPHGQLDKNCLLPLTDIEMEGYTLPVPKAPETFLTLCYGPDWKVPDDTYSYPWGRALSHFVEYNKKFESAITAHLPEIVGRTQPK